MTKPMTDMLLEGAMSGRDWTKANDEDVLVVAKALLGASAELARRYLAQGEEIRRLRATLAACDKSLKAREADCYAYLERERGQAEWGGGRTR